jgi:hypothetical protein
MSDAVSDSELLAAVPQWSGVEEVKWVRWKNMALRLVKIPCGRRNCHKCPHGPYWYLVIWRGKKPVQRYLGRRLYGSRVQKSAELQVLVDRIVEGAGYVVGEEEKGESG